MRRLVPLLAVPVLVAGLSPPMPAGATVGPPAVDDRFLPPAGPAAPPHPTEQRDVCVSAPSVMPSVPPRPADGELAAVWALTRGAGQTVAVIDTGVARHRRLPHLVPGGDFVATQDGTADCDGHGTIVAGIIGAAPDADDPGAFSGIAPDVTLLSIRQASNKFRYREDAASGVGDVETLAAAVRLAADLGATVINISSVACLPADGDLDDRALGAALAYAVDVANAVVVTAAGNVGGPGQCPDRNPDAAATAGDVTVIASPAWYDDYVLTVGSVGAGGAASAFSLTGPWVDVAAPGENVVSLAAAADGLVSTTPAGAPLSGTSYAAPAVSGVAALVRARFPELTARQVMRRIEDTARHPAGGWDAAVGRGVVDVLAAVSGPGSGSRPPRTATPPAQSRAGAPQSGHNTPMRGIVVCAGLLGGVALVCAATGGSRRRTDHICGD